ncbi:MAG: EAL domain-containing protein [Eubacterium sp.]|nr:EAL domain-containing protein [Eubacterium sp.]
MAEHIPEYIQYYENYSPVGDLTVMATCFVFFILMRFSYNIRTRNYRILQAMVASLLVASISDVGYHMVLNNVQSVPDIIVYFLRFLFHFGLFIDLYLYVIYLLEPLQLNTDREGKKFVIFSVAGLIIISAYEIGGFVFQYGFYIDDANRIHDSFNVFMVAYVYFVGIVIYLLLFYRGRMVKQILRGIVGTFLVSVFMFGMQGVFHQMSFTSACFMFPLITLLYMIHSHPYNIEIGAVNVAAFDDMITYIRKNKQERILMSLFLPDFEGTGKHYPKQIQEIIRQFTETYFRGAVLFQMSNGRMVLTANPKKNPDYKESANKMLEQFNIAYEYYRLDYKIVFLRTRDEVNEDNDYVMMLEYTESRMQMNSVCIVGDDEYEDYRKMKYVLTQLEDIKKQGTLYDPRVEVFCQPVLNIATKKYDTAEALMRLRLPETGMVFPDVFIPLAEEHNLIHVLSRIILFKTCVMIKKLLGQGYNVQRISVNFSVSELHDTAFCDDIKSIIDDVGIPHDKIAIEITESQNDREFRIVKDRINELRDEGIKFYLDDFGTGYSNFERIMELPFDIIKFDRSLVIACGSDEKSEQMVSHLARMFSAMDYSVLYEGVETEADEEKCIRMSAKYLQGYKYSKPIPIGELKDWFDKRSA